MEANIKICSWNVNGIKSVVSSYNGLENLQKSLEAHIICFQETKLMSKMDSTLFISNDYFSFFSLCRPPRAYSGTATFIRKDFPILRAQDGLTGLLSDSGDTIVSFSFNDFQDLTEEEIIDLDKEGRCIITGMFQIFLSSQVENLL